MVFNGNMMFLGLLLPSACLFMLPKYFRSIHEGFCFCCFFFFGMKHVPGPEEVVEFFFFFFDKFGPDIIQDHKDECISIKRVNNQNVCLLQILLICVSLQQPWHLKQCSLPLPLQFFSYFRLLVHHVTKLFTGYVWTWFHLLKKCTCKRIIVVFLLIFVSASGFWSYDYSKSRKLQQNCKILDESQEVGRQKLVCCR